MKTGALFTTSLVLVIVGGLNWLLVGLFGFDLVAYLFGEMGLFTRLIYVLVGLAAVHVWTFSMSGERSHLHKFCDMRMRTR